MSTDIIVGYAQCPCVWHRPTTGRCACGHMDTDHDASECWAEIALTLTVHQDAVKEVG